MSYNPRKVWKAGRSVLDGYHNRGLLSSQTLQTGAAKLTEAIRNTAQTPVEIRYDGLGVVFSGFPPPQLVEIAGETLITSPDPFFEVFDDREREEVLDTTRQIFEELRLLQGAELLEDPTRAVLRREVFARKVTLFSAPILSAPQPPMLGEH